MARRRSSSREFKQSLIEACGEPGASVAGVALANGINADQRRRWMRKLGTQPPELDGAKANHKRIGRSREKIVSYTSR